MVLWLAFAVLTAAALAAVLAPLARPARPEESAADETAPAVAVYRHQLEEIDAEHARGLLEPAEAEAAKIEVARRLLAGAAPPRPPAAPYALAESRHASIALVAGILVPLIALGLYLPHGAPGYRAQPAAARAAIPPEEAQVGDLLARVEARLRAHPEDGDGWDVVAPVYFKLGRYRDAAEAFARAARLKGETADRLLGFAEATVVAADGVVSEEARIAFEKVREAAPGRPEAHFWLALAKEQDGKLDEALAAYKALLAQAPADAPWRASLQKRIEEVAARLATPKPTVPGPSAEDVAAADKLSAEERGRMIAGMVDGLAARLERDGSDLAGWQRLVNAYVVLGRKDDARNALARARSKFHGDSKALSELTQLARSLGLGS
jgi:cytochrome c-type biogenesis protein CcmH